MPQLLDQLQNGGPSDPEPAHHSLPEALSDGSTSPTAAFLQLLLLTGVVAGFAALQIQKADYDTCTKDFAILYAGQVRQCDAQNLATPMQPP